MLKKLHNTIYNHIHGGYWFKMYMVFYDESLELYNRVKFLEESLRAAEDTIEALQAKIRVYEK